MTSQELIAQLNAKYSSKYKGNGATLMCGSDLPKVDWISTGLFGYDWINGGGGPRGHIEQIYGPRSSGKTSVTLRRMAECQRLGGKCAFVDAEHTLDKIWAKKHGVNLDELILYEPDIRDSAEVILAMVIDMLASQELDMIVVDSVPALCPQAKLEKGMEDKHYGGVSGVLGQFFDKVIGPGIMHNSGSVLIMINQPREVIGSRIPMERLPGGRALSHYSSIITQVKKGDYITIGSKDTEEKIGVEVKLINQKNKAGKPFREQTLRLHFASGFNPLYDLMLFTKFYKIVDFRGSWAYYNEECLGQGTDQHMRYLMEHMDMYKELKNEVINRIRSGE